jgi:hypothetical protein
VPLWSERNNGVGFGKGIEIASLNSFVHSNENYEVTKLLR